MKKKYECATCGIVTGNHGHLCKPVEVAGLGDYCGQPVTKKTAMMCAEETSRLDYECGNCGRTAETPDLVCAPKKV